MHSPRIAFPSLRVPGVNNKARHTSRQSVAKLEISFLMKSIYKLCRNKDEGGYRLSGRSHRSGGAAKKTGAHGAGFLILQGERNARR
jgi:hypothetical protein